MSQVASRINPMLLTKFNFMFMLVTSLFDEMLSLCWVESISNLVNPLNQLFTTNGLDCNIQPNGRGCSTFWLSFSDLMLRLPSLFLRESLDHGTSTIGHNNFCIICLVRIAGLLPSSGAINSLVRNVSFFIRNLARIEFRGLLGHLSLLFCLISCFNYYLIQHFL
jgi:hypothetical protein